MVIGEDGLENAALRSIAGALEKNMFHCLGLVTASAAVMLT
jgi:hypothetical protein